MEVIAALQTELSENVTTKELSTVAEAAAVMVGGAGATMLKVVEVSFVKPVDENTILAFEIGPRLEAVKPLYVAMPLAAAFPVVPPNVHVVP